MQASIENLKLKLVDFLDSQYNVIDMAGATEIISALEQAEISKDVLEATRLGMVVNSIRKQNQASFPELSKRCRGLIRNWQKLVDGGTTVPLSAIGNGYLSGSASATASPSIPLLSAATSCITPRLQVASAMLARSSSPAIASQIAAKHSLSSSSKSANASPQTGVATPCSSIVPNGSPSVGQHLPSGSTGSQQQTDRPGSSARKTKYEPPVSTPPLQAAAVGNLKLKIKIGGSCPVVTTVVEPCPSSAAVADVVSSLKENKKRKIDNSQWEDLPLQKRKQLESAVKGLHGLPVKVNGIPNVPSIPVLSEFSSSAASDLKRSKSAATICGSKSRGSSEPEPVLDASSYVVPGRPSKLKSTMELVAEMTKESPWSEPLPADSVNEATARPSTSSDISTRQLSSASYNQEAAEELKDSRQRNRELESAKNGCMEVLSEAKSDLVQRLLDSTSKGRNIVSPAASTVHNLSTAQTIVANAIEKVPTPISFAIETTTSVIASAGESKAKPAKLRKQPQPTPQKLREPKRNWYDMLPPLDPVLATVSSEETVETNAEPEQPCVSVSGGDNSHWSTPCVLHVGSEHKLLMMPYVEVGLPEFVEHKLPMPQEIIGFNYDFPDILEGIQEISSANTPVE